MMQQSLGIDFDGVVINFLLGQTWAKKNHVVSTTVRFPWYEKTKESFFHKLRKPMFGVKDFLAESHKYFREVHLITSRNEVVREETIEWLRKKNLLQYFSSLNFLPQGDVSLDHKYRSVSQYKCNVYIDDDLFLIQKLSQKLPQTQFFLMKSLPEVLIPKLSNVKVSPTWLEITSELSKQANSHQ